MDRRTRNAERGQGIVEYVLIAIVVGLIALFAVSRFGGSTSRRYDCAGKTAATAQDRRWRESRAAALRPTPGACTATAGSSPRATATARRSGARRTGVAPTTAASSSLLPHAM